MGTRTCPVCNGTFPEKVRVCPVDGTPLARARTLVGPGGEDPDQVDTLPPAEVRMRTASQVRDPGTVLGSYRILSLLGKGGMGEVYLAEHVKLKRRVALKILRSRYTGDAGAVRRFFNEARAVNQIQHPNIVEITDFVEGEDGNTYYIMEYLEGQTLGERLGAQQPLPLRETLDIAIQVCDALVALHGAGIIHRDLKPENIFLTAADSTGEQRAKLLDFGLVKLAEPPTGESQLKTNPETLIGTPEYMSPEQVRGVDPADHRSDIYSLGVILYEMVTGVRPIAAPSYGQLLINVVSAKPPPPGKVRDEKGPELPPALETLVMKCLEKEPADRPRSAKEILTVLRGVQVGLPPDLATLALPRRARRRSRRPLLLLAGGLLLLAAVVLLFALRGQEPAAPAGERVRSPRGRPIASLTQLWGDVHHREVGRESWTEAGRGMKLCYHDALKTGKGAMGRVSFFAGGRLNVDELSIVLIEPPPEPTGPDGKPAPPVARLQQGTLRVEARPGAPVRFITPDGKAAEVLARGGTAVTVRLRARQGRPSELAVIRGEGELRSGGQKVALKANQLVELAGGRVSQTFALPAYPELLAPGVDQRMKGDAPLVLRWAGAEGAARYRVQLSQFVAFDENLVDTVTDATETRLEPLQPQTYVWRVSGINDRGNEGEFGFARRFIVEAGAAPADRPEGEALLEPADNAVIEIVKEPRPVVFRWSGGASRYFLVVAKRRDLTRPHIEVRRRVNGTTVKLGGIAPGVHYWGVYALEAGKPRPLFQKPRRFVVVQRTRPEVHLPPIEWK